MNTALPLLLFLSYLLPSSHAGPLENCVQRKESLQEQFNACVNSQAMFRQQVIAGDQRLAVCQANLVKSTNNNYSMQTQFNAVKNERDQLRLTLNNQEIERQELLQQLDRLNQNIADLRQKVQDTRSTYTNQVAQLNVCRNRTRQFDSYRNVVFKCLSCVHGCQVQYNDQTQRQVARCVYKRPGRAQ